jgi:hypothetical protein
MSTQPTYKTILDLAPAGAKTGNELIEVVQDGVSKQMPLSQVAPAPTPTADLEVADALGGDELIEIVQDGEAKQILLADIIPEVPHIPATTELAAAGAKDGSELIEVTQAGVPKKMALAAAIAFDKYDLKVQASTGALDFSKQQVHTIDNSAATAKTVTFSGAPAGRAATYVVVILGKAGAVTWPGATTLAWNADTPPDLGANRTVVVLLWDGATFTGMQGPTR